MILQLFAPLRTTVMFTSAGDSGGGGIPSLILAP